MSGENRPPLRIRVHPALCEGHGVCRRFAPSVYQLDEEGYLDLHLLEVPEELEADARLGAGVCPAHAISVVGGGAPVEIR